MISQYRTANQGGVEAMEPEKEVARTTAQGRATKSWRDRVLPPAGTERKLFLGLAALVVGLKLLAIVHYRADADETQHAHVVWAWASGQLQYRDVFDNHMPLFQMMMAPFMALIGPRADIMIWLRVLMIPFYLGCLACVYLITGRLFSIRIAPWAALAAAALPRYFYTSTEFRPDDLWALFWLASLLIALSGRFSFGRALGFGLMLGMTFACSLKTVVLSAALISAVAIAMTFAWRRGEDIGLVGANGRVLAIISAALVPLALIVRYFYLQGALEQMEYCVVWHNIVPGLKRWGHFSLHEWIFPISLVFLGALAWLTFRTTRDTALAMRRTIVVLMPWLFVALLWSYWPDITREDDLPYTPLVALTLIPLCMWFHERFEFPRIEARFFTSIVPGLILAEVIWLWNYAPLRTDRLKVTTRSIQDVLTLTSPKDYVFDARGDYIFRNRPTYWVFETITKTRMRLGLIKDDIIERLEKTETPVCYLWSAHASPTATRFMLANYISFDPAANDLGVAGKELQAADGSYSFDVEIPANYSIVSETGVTAGTLDGESYNVGIRLAAGHHVFTRTAGAGRVALFLAKAAENGFHPLFDVSERFVAQQEPGVEE